jgi:hypothetical protein
MTDRGLVPLTRFGLKQAGAGATPSDFWRLGLVTWEHQTDHHEVSLSSFSDRQKAPIPANQLLPI